jgi:hypothetical protein
VARCPSGSLVRTPSSQLLPDSRIPAREVRIWEIAPLSLPADSRVTGNPSIIRVREGLPTILQLTVNFSLAC